ncbi:hypothetical protein INT43_004178 [Umbelopsis isabellina]|uniref:Uncharacterized protein n=1 Tax=Mortierella isabellina TaxID=91625 RepID=A0A8H7UBT8_MORIS|nr:hypothetical protein INT43_004178 [Umbelopsis isabellina]
MNRLPGYLILLLLLVTLCSGSPISKRQYNDDQNGKNYLRIATPNSGTIWQADSFQSVTWVLNGNANFGYSESIDVILLALDSSDNWKQVDTLPSATAGGGISNYHVRKDLGKAKAYMVVLEISKIGYRVRSEQFKITAVSGHNNGDDNSYDTSTGHYESDYNNNQDGGSYSGHYESDYNSNQDGSWSPGDYESGSTSGYDSGSWHHNSYDQSDYSSSSDEASHDSYNDKKPLSLVTPTSATVWQADSYQSVTWKFDGNSHLGYGEQVSVYLLALSESGDWKHADILPSGTTGGGISNYHVRSDLGKAMAYKVVIEIVAIQIYIESEEFRITTISSHSDYADIQDYKKNDNKNYLRIVTPNAGTVWKADSFQSVTWAISGIPNFGYSERIEVILLALDASGSWKKVDTLPSGTAGGGISNYHVRKDLGKAKAYKVVLEMSKYGIHIQSQEFKIQAISGHSNDEWNSYDEDGSAHGTDDYKSWDDDSYSDKSHNEDYDTDNDSSYQSDYDSSEHDNESDSYSDHGNSQTLRKDYLRIVTPNSGTVWDADSYQSVTWATNGGPSVNYGLPVEVYLFSYDSSTKTVKLADTLPKGTVGSGISNYHVKSDLGKADWYIIVLEIKSENYRIHSKPFVIKKQG